MPGSPGENKCLGRKNNCKLNLFSMYFIQNNEEIHLSFKNSGHKLEKNSQYFVY